jgi:hypothetical protein
VTNEVCFSWESVYADRTDTVTSGVYTQPSDNFDVTQADADLGDLLEEDHDRPPLGTFAFGPAYDGTCFILKDNLLYYCKPRQPEYWPALYYVEVSAPQFPLITGVFHNGQPYVMTANEVYYVQGTGHGTFLPLPMRAKTGARSKRGAVSVIGKGIYHVGPDGIYLFGSGTDLKISEEILEPIFRGETVHGLPGVGDLSTSWLYVHSNRLYFGYAGESDDYPVNVLVTNLDSGRLSYYAYDDGAAVAIRSLATDNANSRLLIGDDTGYVRVIEQPDYTDDSGEPIEFELQSKDFTLQTRRHFPRWVKYDIDASGADSASGILLLDGEVHHTHTLTENRNTRRRLVSNGNGNKAAIRITGTGPVSIYAVESE